MNEIMACVTYAFYEEKEECNVYDLDEVAKSITLYKKYINSTKFIDADIYTVYDKVMAFGLKDMFITEESST